MTEQYNTEIEIKARLYDIQYHKCNGVLTLDTFDKWKIKTNKECEYCAEILQLKNKLSQLYKEEHDK